MIIYSNYKLSQMKQLLYAFLASAILPACKTLEVQKTDLKTVESGAIYKLPKTQVVFEITVKTTTYEKSPLGCYDTYKKFFAGSVSENLIAKLDKSNSVVSAKVAEVVISPIPVTDENKIFKLSTNKRFFRNNVWGLNIDDNGILAKGDFSSESQVIPIVSQLISSAASFVSPFTAVRGADEVDKMLGKNVDICKEVFEKLRTLDASKSEFSSLINFKNADQLPSKEVYDRVLTEFENTKTSLFSQLMFSTDIQLDKAVIRYTPGADDRLLVNGELLFGFMKNANNEPEIHVNNELVGDPSSFALASPGVRVVSEKKATILGTKGIELYYVKIVPLSSDKTQLSAIQSSPRTTIQPVEASTDKAGIFYNIPLNCKVYLQKGLNNNWKEASIMFPQWGGLGRLSDKMTKQTIELNPLYGNLKSLQGEAKTIPTDQIKSFGESLSQARDVFYTDPVTRMERRIKYLETKDKLTEAEGNELTELRRQKDLLQVQKDVLELKKAIKDYEE
jgi:hypothetical protein